jgi:predicted transcriptional regulator
MTQSTRRSERPPDRSAVESAQCSHQAPVDADTLLALLGDDYAYQILKAVVERPRTGREIREATGVSKATVYRRLDRLEEAGIVDSTMQLDEDGHHCKQFHAVTQSIQVQFGEDEFTAQIEAGSDAANDKQERIRRRSPADD